MLRTTRAHRGRIAAPVQRRHFKQAVVMVVVVTRCLGGVVQCDVIGDGRRGKEAVTGVVVTTGSGERLGAHHRLSRLSIMYRALIARGISAATASISTNVTIGHQTRSRRSVASAYHGISGDAAAWKNEHQR